DKGLCASYLAAMEVLAKPWTGMLLVVLEEGPLRFSEIADRVPTIADRMLATRLKELESRGLIERRVEPGPAVKVAYELTEVGRGFREFAQAVEKWGKTLVRDRAKRAAGGLQRKRA